MNCTVLRTNGVITEKNTTLATNLNNQLNLTLQIGQLINRELSFHTHYRLWRGQLPNYMSFCNRYLGHEHVLHRLLIYRNACLSGSHCNSTIDTLFTCVACVKFANFKSQDTPHVQVTCHREIFHWQFESKQVCFDNFGELETRHRSALDLVSPTVTQSLHIPVTPGIVCAGISSLE